VRLLWPGADSPSPPAMFVCASSEAIVGSQVWGWWLGRGGKERWPTGVQFLQL